VSRCRFRRRSDSGIFCWRIGDGLGIRDGFLMSGRGEEEGRWWTCPWLYADAQLWDGSRLATVGNGTAIKVLSRVAVETGLGRSLKVGR